MKLAGNNQTTGSVLLVIIVFSCASPSCGSGATSSPVAVRCGPGTREEDGLCVPVDLDGAVEASSSDSGAESGASPDVAADSNAEPICAQTQKCPTTVMITIPRPADKGGTYQIDAYETTEGEYQRFLEDVHASLVPKQGEDCWWNEAFDQAKECAYIDGIHDICMKTGTDRLLTPVTCVDQCDAQAYCTWAGKRLCTDAEPSKTLPAPWASEVYDACSNAGANPDPNPGENASGCLACEAVCEDATTGVFNLAGGFAEWTSKCTPAGTFPDCTVIGGGSMYSPTCNYRTYHAANDPILGISFRCCR
jgi:formylglycine-generating enzyme